MVSFFKDDSKYKLLYSIIALVLASVISICAGYGYRLSLVLYIDSVFSSYGELLVAFILTISGTAVLLFRKKRINAIFCLIMILLQLFGFYFCENYELSERISVIKWVSLLIAPFTLLLYEPKKKSENDIQITSSYDKPVVEISICILLGIVLVFSGISALFQSGVLFAENEFLSRENSSISILFFCLAIILLINGFLNILFAYVEIKKAVSYFKLLSLALLSSIVFPNVIAGIPALLFYVIIMLVSAIYELIVIIIKNTTSSVK